MSAYYDYESGGGPQRRTVVIAASAAVVGLCAAFLIGYATRGGSRAAADPTGHATPSSTSTSTASAPLNAASRPASTGPPATSTRAPLRLNIEAVIVGYSQDQAGAVAAAGNYTASLYVQTNRTHARELAVLSSIAASPADAARMAGDFSTEDAALAQLLSVADLQSDGVIAYGHPQGYRVESATTNAATVDVYVAGGQGVVGAPSDSAAAGHTFYEVDQVQLVWQQGDWQLKNWSHLVENDGPQMATVAAAGYLPFPIGQVSGA
jgi:hypothetical protein